VHVNSLAAPVIKLMAGHGLACHQRRRLGRREVPPRRVANRL